MDDQQNDAGCYLDLSQGIAPEGYPRDPGRPRAFALGTNTRAASINSLQDYSRWGVGAVSGLVSRANQNELVHAALRSADCVNKMDKLNNAKTLTEICKYNVGGNNYVIYQTWLGRSTEDCGATQGVTLVLGHFPGQADNKNANVHIFSARPT